MTRTLRLLGVPVALVLFAAAAVGAFKTASIALAHEPSGAIFTTVVDGTEVNANHYDAKEDVYLDGGPGEGAPQTAAGLDDGTYVYMVTDPSGKTLLSTDNAACRRFTVANGIITAVVPAGGCEHQTGNDVDHPPAKTVQLFPYQNTPNPGGVYKAWITFVEDYQCSLSVVDCTVTGAKHGFIPGHSKTDNFKVKKDQTIVEIDTRFFVDTNGNGHQDAGENFIDGLPVTWTDTLGASNKKWSYSNNALRVNHEAHVEAIEAGVHTIQIDNQTGCSVGLVHLDNVDQQVGPQTVIVNVNSVKFDHTYYIDVACAP